MTYPGYVARVRRLRDPLRDTPALSDRPPAARLGTASAMKQQRISVIQF